MTGEEIFGLILLSYMLRWFIGCIIAALPRNASHSFMWKFTCMFLLGWEFVALWSLSNNLLIQPIKLHLPPVWPYWFFGPLGWLWYYTKTLPRERNHAGHHA